MVVVKCSRCSQEFQRSVKEHNRSLRLGRREYCSRSCCGQDNSQHLQQYVSENKVNLISDNKRDEYSLFRKFLNSIKHRNKESNVTIEYLKEIWDAQEGICPLTNIQMSKRGTYSPWQMSLDRIDSSKGYIIGNVRFICLMAQCCKSHWSDEELIQFCHKVVENHA